jgi:hypothetical protein
MLTDVEFGPLAEGQTVERLGTGVYLCHAVSPEEAVGECFFRNGPFTLGGIDGGYQFNPWLETCDSENSFARGGLVTYKPYGTCDTPEQIRDFYGDLLDDPEQPIFISMYEIKWHRDCEWRWHKNGPYIGDQSPQAEYFGDEPVIRRVLAYHIHALNGLIPADVERATQAVYGCYDEAGQVAWEAAAPERQQKYRDHTKMILEMFQICEAAAPHREKSREELAAAWYHRLRKDESDPAWNDAREETRAEYLEFITTIWNRIERAGVRWLPPSP